MTRRILGHLALLSIVVLLPEAATAQSATFGAPPRPLAATFIARPVAPIDVPSSLPRFASFWNSTAPMLAAATWATGSPAANPARSLSPAINDQGPPAVAVEYSDAYNMRAKVHRIASFATLPLFGTEAILGQSLYNSPTSGKKTAHLAVAGGIAALFAVNSVTGVWNLIEARHDPHGRTRRLTHGLLMLAADAGFLATAMLGPEHEHGELEGSPATHRAVAFTSIGAATAGYLTMIIGGH